MKMLTYLALALLSVAAQAATSFSFYPDPNGGYYCTNWCTGFATSDAHTVDYVMVKVVSPYLPVIYQVTLSIDGVAYQGNSSGSGATFQAGTLLASVNWATVRTCTGSGRYQHCVNHYNTTQGNVSGL